MKISEKQVEESLDPTDWESLRTLSHRMVDDMLDYIRTAGERPAWKKPTPFAISNLNQPLPQYPSSAEEVYDDFLNHLLPYNLPNMHPRFWAWVQGGGTPVGMLADMLASGMNTNTSIGDHIAMYVDKQVIEWSKEMMGFPAGASGLLTSGASIANITALITARNSLNEQMRSKGLHAVDGQLVIYGSAETHNCVYKAAEVIGVGNEFFRKIPVDANYEVRVDLLEKAIIEDIAIGLIPFCIVGNAGTVNTGAIDNLAKLSAIAKQYGCWFHIDGAFGAIPKILPEFESRLAGLSSADSLSFDFHKWMYVNYEVACVLIRDAEAHRNAFVSKVSYLVPHKKGVSAGPDPIANYGMELSRGFKALKVWMLLKEHGIEKYRRIVRQNLEQSQYLSQLIKNESTLELLATVSLNIICYRFNPGNLDNEDLNELNKEILIELHEQGIAVPSYTMLQGRYAIRVAHTNHRSRREDFDILVKETKRIGLSVLKFKHAV